MKAKTRHKFGLGLLAICIILLPILVTSILSKPEVSNYITNTLKIELDSFISVVLDYISLITTLVLGIFVFYQSERINKLQASQYEAFLDIKGLDYSFSFGNDKDEYAIDKSSNEFLMAHVIDFEKKAIITSTNIGTGSATPIFLPLVFEISSHQQITSLDLLKVKVEAKGNKGEGYNKTFSTSGERIKAVFENGSRFVLGFGMLVPKEEDILDIKLNLTLEAEYQDGYKQKRRADIELERTNGNSRFSMISGYVNPQ